MVQSIIDAVDFYWVGLFHGKFMWAIILMILYESNAVRQKDEDDAPVMQS